MKPDHPTAKRLRPRRRRAAVAAGSCQLTGFAERGSYLREQPPNARPHGRGVGGSGQEPAVGMKAVADPLGSEGSPVVGRFPARRPGVCTAVAMFRRRNNSPAKTCGNDRVLNHQAHATQQRRELREKRPITIPEAIPGCSKIALEASTRSAHSHQPARAGLSGATGRRSSRIPNRPARRPSLGRSRPTFQRHRR